MAHESKQLTKEEARLRASDPDNRTENCMNCRFFRGTEDKCVVVEGRILAEQLCDWIQSRGVVDGPQYQVSEDDWLAFGVGMIEVQPYSHIVRGVANTPAGQLVMIQDTADPPHYFSLTREFHIEHTSLEHHWTQEEVDQMIRIGKDKMPDFDEDEEDQ